MKRVFKRLFQVRSSVGSLSKAVGVRLLGLGLISFGISNKRFFAEDIPYKLDENESTGPDRVYEVVLPRELELNDFIELYIDHKDGLLNVLVIRDSLGNLRAMRGNCVYDRETRLVDGILIRDKLICPGHGCEYNITNGEAEGPPVINTLPIFNVTELGPGKIGISIPDKPPKEVKPFMTPRDFNDDRKISIIGLGAGGLSCVERLRRMGYTGDITVFTKGSDFPFQKHNLTKYLDFTGRRNLLYYRDASFLTDNNINVIYNAKIKTFNYSIHNPNFVEVEDGSKFMHDALIISTGSDEYSEPFLSERMSDNCVILNNLFDYRKSKRLLKTAKNVTLFNLTPEGMEFASTLRTNRDDLNVSYLNSTRPSDLEKEFGKVMSEEFIKLLKDKGVNVETKASKLTQIRDRSEVIKGYYVKKENEPVKRIDTDLFYLFPSYDEPNTELFSSPKFIHQFSTDNWGRIVVNEENRTKVGAVFALGSITNFPNLITGNRFKNTSWMDTYNQGENAVYNVLALRLQRIRAPYNYYNLFGETVHHLGKPSTDSETSVVGSIKDLNFMTFYTKNGYLVGATSAGREYNKYLLILREAFNNGYILDDVVLSNDPETYFTQLHKKLINQKGSACLRQNAFANRFKYHPQDILFMDSAERSTNTHEEFMNSRMTRAVQEETQRREKEN